MTISAVPLLTVLNGSEIVQLASPGAVDNFTTVQAIATFADSGAGGAGSFTTLAASGIATLSSGQVAAVRVVTAAGAVTAATSDYIVVVNKTVGAATAVNLPSSPTTGTMLRIKDGKGDAATNNITVMPAAGTIDGAATYVINVNYGAVDIVYNGTSWSIV